MAAGAASCMTSPSLPVIVSWPLPGMIVTSVDRSSPPSSVHARPVVTPMPCSPCLAVAELGWTQVLGKAFRIDLDLRVAVALDDLNRDLAADRGDLAVKGPHARLFRVVADNAQHRAVGEGDILRVEAVRLTLLVDQVLLGD